MGTGRKAMYQLEQNPDPHFQNMRVGVAVVLYRDGKFLLGKRQSGSSHGQQTWSIPGGHHEFGETIAEAGVREVKEETGICIPVTTTIDPGPWSEATWPEVRRQYLSAFLAVEAPHGVEPQNLEPEKHSEWRWVEWGGEGLPLFAPLQKMMNRYASLYDFLLYGCHVYSDSERRRK